MTQSGRATGAFSFQSPSCAISRNAGDKNSGAALLTDTASYESQEDADFARS